MCVTGCNGTLLFYGQSPSLLDMMFMQGLTLRPFPLPLHLSPFLVIMCQRSSYPDFTLASVAYLAAAPFAAGPLLPYLGNWINSSCFSVNNKAHSGRLCSGFHLCPWL